MLILRRSNSIVTASGIITLHKQPYSALVESRPVKSALKRRTVWLLTRVSIQDAVTIQFDLLRMSMVLLEACQGL